MGWQREGTREGWLVALVLREGTGTNSGLYRELASPDNVDRDDVKRLQAACDCGWRSAHWSPIHRYFLEGQKRQHTRWIPCIAIASDEDEERARALWSAHVSSADDWRTGHGCPGPEPDPFGPW